MLPRMSLRLQRLDRSGTAMSSSISRRIWCSGRPTSPSDRDCAVLVGGLDVIRKEARPFYRTSSGVRLCWELEEPKGPKGRTIKRQ